MNKEQLPKGNKKFNIVESGKLEQDLCGKYLPAILQFMVGWVDHDITKNIARLTGKYQMPIENIKKVDTVFSKTFPEKNFKSMKAQRLQIAANTFMKLACAFDWIEQNTYRDTEQGD